MLTDDCDPDPCLYGGNCTDRVNGFTCECPPLFTGDRCQTRPDDLCAEKPCEDGSNEVGMCVEDYINSAPLCVCQAGYTSGMCGEGCVGQDIPQVCVGRGVLNSIYTSGMCGEGCVGQDIPQVCVGRGVLDRIYLKYVWGGVCLTGYTSGMCGEGVLDRIYLRYVWGEVCWTEYTSGMCGEGCVEQDIPQVCVGRGVLNRIYLRHVWGGVC